MEDQNIIYLILRNLNIIDIFKSKRVCHKWRKVIESLWFPRMCGITHMEVLLFKHYDKAWDIRYLSQTISMRIIKHLWHWPWDYHELSKNPNITWRFICANKDKLWNYKHLSANPVITWDIVKANPDLPWDYDRMSANPNITWEIICANPGKCWDYKEMSSNPNIKMEHVLTRKWGWDYKKLSAHPNITWNDVKANPGLPWNYRAMSVNPNITFDIVCANLSLPWDGNLLAINVNITLDIMKKHPIINWGCRVSGNINISGSYVLDNITVFRDYYNNPNFTWQIISVDIGLHSMSKISALKFRLPVIL